MEARRKPGYHPLEITLESQLEEDYLVDLIEYGITRMQFPAPTPSGGAPLKATLSTFETTAKFGNELLKAIRRGER